MQLLFTHAHTFTHTAPPLVSVIDIVWWRCKDTNGSFSFLEYTSKERNGWRQFGHTPLKNSLCVIHPALFTARTFNNLWNTRPTHRCCSASRPEKDFLVTERISFPCRNLGKRQTTWSISDLTFTLWLYFVRAAWNITLRWSWTYSFFSLSNAEKGPFMSSMVQEISFFWRSLSDETKTDRIVKTPHPANNCCCNVNKTLCGFTFQVRGETFETLKLYSKQLHA